MIARLFHPLVIALLLALAVRILPASWNYVIGTDEALYLTLGGHLAAGDGFTADGIHPHSEFDPGYPLFAALIYRLTSTIPFSPNVTAAQVGWLELPARLNILLLGSLLVVPIYFLGRALEPGDETVAARAAWLTATVPALALGVPNFEAASEQLYILAIWSGWLCLWLGLTQRRARWLLASGVAFGLAHLTRWEGLVSAGAGLLVAVVWLWSERESRFKSGGLSFQAARYPLTAAAALVGGVLLLAAPYALYQTARTGSVFSTKSIVHQLHGEALASSDPYAWERAYANYERVRDNTGLYPPLPVYLWERRAETAALYARNTVAQVHLLFVSPTFLFVLWLPFAVLGALKFRRRVNWFLAATLVPALVFPLSVIDGRYLLPLVPAGMVWAARGLGWADRRIQDAVTRLRFEYAVTALLLSLFVVADLAAMFFIPRPTEYRDAGLALRGRIPPGAPVLMRKRQIAFYANASFESLPFSDLAGVRAYAHEKGAELFVVDARTTPATRPELVYLLYEHPPSLQVVYQAPAEQVIVYKLSQ